jgi:hypothetical protein
LTVRPTDLVSLVHLGCARNLIDSELILGRLAEEGLVITNDPAEAHTVVVNTCSFIGPARDESHATIDAYIAKKRSGELARVVVAGCLVQRFGTELRERHPDVDVFAEISDYRELAKTVRRLVDGADHRDYLSSPGLRATASGTRGRTRGCRRTSSRPTAYAPRCAISSRAGSRPRGRHSRSRCNRRRRPAASRPAARQRDGRGCGEGLR